MTGIFFCEVGKAKVDAVRSRLGLDNTTTTRHEGFRGRGRRGRRVKARAVEALRIWLETLPVIQAPAATAAAIKIPTDAPDPSQTLNLVQGHYDRVTVSRKATKGVKSLRDRDAALFNALVFLGERTLDTASGTLADSIADFPWPYPQQGPQIELAQTGGDWTWSYKVTGDTQRSDTQQHLSGGQGTERSKALRVYFVCYQFKGETWTHVFYAGPHPADKVKRFKVKGALPPPK